MVRPSSLVLIAGLFAATSGGEEISPKRMLMTWVSPYAVAQCQSRLNESFEGIGVKDGITHLALQFWAPTKTGGVEPVAKYGAISDATVLGFREWAHAHGIRVML